MIQAIFPGGDLIRVPDISKGTLCCVPHCAKRSGRPYRWFFCGPHYRLVSRAVRAGLHSEATTEAKERFYLFEAIGECIEASHFDSRVRCERIKYR